MKSYPINEFNSFVLLPEHTAVSRNPFKKFLAQVELTEEKKSETMKNLKKKYSAVSTNFKAIIFFRKCFLVFFLLLKPMLFFLVGFCILISQAKFVVVTILLGIPMLYEMYNQTDCLSFCQKAARAVPMLYTDIILLLYSVPRTQTHQYAYICNTHRIASHSNRSTNNNNNSLQCKIPLFETRNETKKKNP